MTKPEGNLGDEAHGTAPWGECIGHSCFVIHSSFACHAVAERRRVIRHLDL